MSLTQNVQGDGAGIVSATTERPVSRRRLLRGGLRGLGAAFGAVAGTAAAVRAKGSPPSVSADVDPGSLTKKLVDRVTFGATPGELALADSLGYNGYLEYQLNSAAIPEDPLVTARLNGTTMASIHYTGEQLYDPLVLASSAIAVSQLTDAFIFRATFSKRQLFEKMVEFWTDHLSIDITVDNAPYLKTLDDRNVIRTHALGRFPDLLLASAMSPAMLNYLDNDDSQVNAINENYGRELLELHTLGVDGGYTQADVVAVARCLTGWDWYRGRSTPTNLRGTFRYQSTRHDNQSKTLSPLFNLANPTQPLIIAAGGGMNDGMQILDILGRHPVTAGFIARKLCHKLIGEDCPQQVIDAVKATYLNNGVGVIGDIKSMIRTALAPNILADASPRLKRPFHLFASGMRGALRNADDVATFSTLKTYYTKSGHLPFVWGPPDGYPDTTEYWSGQVLPRWNFGARLMCNSAGTTGGINGVTVDANVVLALFPTQTTRDQVVARIEQVFFAGGMPTGERASLTAFLPAAGALTATQKRDAVGLALDSPGFQWY